jgi:hypothetical protein
MNSTKTLSGSNHFGQERSGGNWRRFNSPFGRFLSTKFRPKAVFGGLIFSGKLYIRASSRFSPKVIHVLRNNSTMKRIVPVLLFSLFLFASTDQITSAEGDGPAVNGSFQFSIAGAQTSNIDFSVTQLRDGTTLGEMTFAQDRPEGNQGSPETDQGTSSSRFFLKAQLDCLVVSKTKAIISGAISEASVKSYIGRRVILVVEDNSREANGKKPDRLTWGVYRVPKQDWLASDSERPDDAGVAPTWVAQDVERVDDAGVLSTQSEGIGCSSFPLSAFSFVDERSGHGKIHVSP